MVDSVTPSSAPSASNTQHLELTPQGAIVIALVVILIIAGILFLLTGGGTSTDTNTITQVVSGNDNNQNSVLDKNTLTPNQSDANKPPIRPDVNRPNPGFTDANRPVPAPIDTNYCKNTSNINFGGITGIASNTNDNTSSVQNVQSKPKFVLIYDGNLFVKAVSLDVNLTNQELVEVLKNNNVQNFVSVYPLVDFSNYLKTNSIACYNSFMKIALLTGEEKPIEKYCKSPDSNFNNTTANGVIAVTTNSPDMNGFVVPGGERAPYFLILNQKVLTTSIKNTFIDMNASRSIETDTALAAKVSDEIKKTGASTIVVAGVSTIFETELKRNGIACITKGTKLSDLFK